MCEWKLHSCLSSACTESLVISFVSFSIWLKRHRPPLPLFAMLSCNGVSEPWLSFRLHLYVHPIYLANRLILWMKTAILMKKMCLFYMLEIITTSLHKQYFDDSVRMECWGKYGSFVWGHSRLDREQRAVLFESPSCSRDIHSAHLSILPPMQWSIWLASVFLCQDVHNPSCGHSAYFPTLLWAVHLCFLWLSLCVFLKVLILLNCLINCLSCYSFLAVVVCPEASYFSL